MGKKYYSKYFILAIIGSIIIGLAVFLLINNYLDKKEIVVASRNISGGEKINGEDLYFKEYYKNSLPENYLTKKEDIIGKIINIERKKDDYISSDMFSKGEVLPSIFNCLSGGDVLITVNVQYTEPILTELKIGNNISIVSTEYDNELMYSNSNNLSNTGNTKYLNQSSGNNENNTSVKNRYFLSEGDYIDNTIIELSDNVMLINGQIIVRNLEIICIEKDILDNKNILLNNSITSVYLKCNIKEAPFVAKLTKSDNYKIIVEGV